MHTLRAITSGKWTHELWQQLCPANNKTNIVTNKPSRLQMGYTLGFLKLGALHRERWMQTLTCQILTKYVRPRIPQNKRANTYAKTFCNITTRSLRLIPRHLYVRLQPHPNIRHDKTFNGVFTWFCAILLFLGTISHT